MLTSSLVRGAGIQVSDDVIDPINLIYEAVTETSQWQTVLDSIVQSVGARRGLLSLFSTVSDASHIFRISGWTPEEIALYNDRYAADDPWRIAVARQTEWPVLIDTDICPREVSETSAAYREFYKPKGAAHGMGGGIYTGHAARSVITVTRSLEDGPFGEPERAVLSALIPHLKRAALLHSELASQRAQLATFTAHLDRLPYPFLLTDSARRALYLNAAARQLTVARDGIAIESGRVTLGSLMQDRILEKAGAGTAGRTDDDFDRIEIPRHSGKRPARLLIMRASVSGALPWGVSQPSLALQFIDPDSGTAPDAAIVEKLFSLTPSEARVTVKLAVGRNVEEIAADTRTSVGTIRTHLKRILSKTGTKRQGELISLILRSTSSLPVKQP